MLCSTDYQKMYNYKFFNSVFQHSIGVALSNGLFHYDVWTLQEIEHFYNNIIILKNEDGIDELGFEDVKICEEYVYKILPIFANYHSNQTVAVMQCIADIIKSMNVKGYISIDDLYKSSEKDVINKILHCNYEYIRNIFIKWQNVTYVYRSDTPIKDKYCTSVKGKVRYIIPWKRI